MPGVNGLSGVNGMTGGGGLSGGGRNARSERIIRRRRNARRERIIRSERNDRRGRIIRSERDARMGRDNLRGRLDTSMPIAWIIGPAAHLFHAAMKLFEPLGF